jgi:hypothetical protein
MQHESRTFASIGVSKKITERAMEKSGAAKDPDAKPEILVITKRCLPVIMF